MSAGKGSAPRNCFSREFRENHELIFPPVTDAEQRPGLQRRRGAEEEEYESELKGHALAKVGRALKSSRTVDPHPLS